MAPIETYSQTINGLLAIEHTITWVQKQARDRLPAEQKKCQHTDELIGKRGPFSGYWAREGQ